MAETRRSRLEKAPRLLVTELIVRNFKNISDTRIPLRPGVNVLVGPNASGKTSLLEAAYFLYKALVEAAERTPYRPHSPDYWGALDIIKDRDPSKTVEIGLSMEIYHRGERAKWWCSSDVEAIVGFEYDQQRDTLLPQRYVFNINRELLIDINKDSVRVEVPLEAWRKAGNPGRSWASQMEEDSSRGRAVLVFSVEQPPRFLHPYIVKRVIPELDEEKRLRGTGRPSYWASLIKFLVLNVRVPVVWRPHVRCQKRPWGIPLGLDDPLFPLVGLEHMSPVTLIDLFFRAVERIVLLRHPDAGALREPRPFTGSERLYPRAQNLADVLLTLQGRYGRMPERIERLLEKAFPGYRVWVESKFGRVVLLAEWRGVELPPPNMPDGLIKVLAIGAAMGLEPSLLLVDEVENSLHASLLEVLFDELNTLPVPVLAATHSPIPVDLAGPERTLIARLGPEGATVERVGDPRRLRDELAELGIAFSDYIYGVTKPVEPAG